MRKCDDLQYITVHTVDEGERKASKRKASVHRRNWLANMWRVAEQLHHPCSFGAKTKSDRSTKLDPVPYRRLELQVGGWMKL